MTKAIMLVALAAMLVGLGACAQDKAATANTTTVSRTYQK